MQEKTRKFFLSLGIPILNGYGLSETSAAITHIEWPGIGGKDLSKTGRKLPGTQVKIYNPDEDGLGEICMKGRNIFMGYLSSPSDTLSAFDAEGYFHSGDLGKVDENG